MSKKLYEVRGGWLASYSIVVEAEHEQEARDISDQYIQENNVLADGEWGYHDVEECVWEATEDDIYRPKVEEEVSA